MRSPTAGGAAGWILLACLATGAAPKVVRAAGDLLLLRNEKIPGKPVIIEVLTPAGVTKSKITLGSFKTVGTVSISAISPDGSMVVYASSRGKSDNNLLTFVQLTPTVKVKTVKLPAFKPFFPNDATCYVGNSMAISDVFSAQQQRSLYFETYCEFSDRKKHCASRRYITRLVFDGATSAVTGFTRRYTAGKTPAGTCKGPNVVVPAQRFFGKKPQMLYAVQYIYTTEAPVTDVYTTSRLSIPDGKLLQVGKSQEANGCQLFTLESKIRFWAYCAATQKGAYIYEYTLGKSPKRVTSGGVFSFSLYTPGKIAIAPYGTRLYYLASPLSQFDDFGVRRTLAEMYIYDTKTLQRTGSFNITGVNLADFDLQVLP